MGWVCALPVELAASQEMLDEEHETPEHKGIIPHTPVRKSIFSYNFEEMTDSSPMSFAARRRTHLTSFGRELAPPNDKKLPVPSLPIGEPKFRRSDSSVSSVRETRVLDKSIDIDGQKRINQYTNRQCMRGRRHGQLRGLETKLDQTSLRSRAC